MSLDYSTKDIADNPALTDERGYWIPEFQSVCFATMPVGINRITASNVQEFYRRYVVWNMAYGYEPYFTLEKLELFIGLSTNASSKTISAFNKDVLAILERRTKTLIHSQLETKRLESDS